MIEQTREEIANLRLPVNNQPNHKYRYLNYELADRILSLKTGSLTIGELIEKYEKGELLEKADNQELPENPYDLYINDLRSAKYHSWKDCQQDMLKEGWVKCERKEK